MPSLEPPLESPTQTNRAPQDFVCEIRPSGRGAVWIRACGELDLSSAPRFEHALREALHRALLVVIDLRELSFIDSTGLRAMIEADARARGSARRLVFIRGPSHVDRLFELVGLSGRLEVLDPDAALGQALSAPSTSEVER